MAVVALKAVTVDCNRNGRNGHGVVVTLVTWRLVVAMVMIAISVMSYNNITYWKVLEEKFLCWKFLEGKVTFIFVFLTS